MDSRKLLTIIGKVYIREPIYSPTSYQIILSRTWPTVSRTNGLATHHHWIIHLKIKSWQTTDNSVIGWNKTHHNWRTALWLAEINLINWRTSQIFENTNTSKWIGLQLFPYSPHMMKRRQDRDPSLHPLPTQWDSNSTLIPISDWQHWWINCRQI